MAHLQVVNLKLGRRARELSLPFRSMDHGVYQVTFDGDCTFVRHRFRDAPPVMIDPPKKKGLYIDMNFSEFRATVKVLETGWQQACVVLFPAGCAKGGRGGGTTIDTADEQYEAFVDEDTVAEDRKAANNSDGSALRRGAAKRAAPPGAEHDFRPPRPIEKRLRIQQKTSPLALENGEE